MQEEYKRCPFCGGNKVQFERWIIEEPSYEILYRLFCASCGYTPDHWEALPEEAIQYWNTRFLEDELRTEIIKLTIDKIK